MASPATDKKKLIQKAAVLLQKMMKLLHSQGLGKLAKTQTATRRLRYKEKNKKMLVELRTPRSKSIRVLAAEAASIADECNTIRTIYDDFLKQSAGLTEKEFLEQKTEFLNEIKEKRDALKSFWDTLRVKYMETTKLEGRVRKKAKELKDDPEEFEMKIGFPLDEAKKKATRLHGTSKQLIKIGVEIRRAEMQLEFK